MSWHNTTIPTERLAAVLADIRKSGGTVMTCVPIESGVMVTWTTPDWR